MNFNQEILQEIPCGIAGIRGEHTKQPIQIYTEMCNNYVNYWLQTEIEGFARLFRTILRVDWQY